MTEETLLGVDLGGTNVRAGLVRGQRLLSVETARLDAKQSAEGVMQQIQTLIDQYAAHDGVKALGIGVPSVVDSEGVVYDVQNIPSWEKVPVKSILEDTYGLPIFVNNDANCFALAEKYYGQAQGYKSLVGLIVGTGCAGGVIVDDHLYAGPHCGAGEFGMLPYRESIFEHYCSGQFFDRTYGTSGAQMYERAMADDDEALAAFTEFGRHLGEAIKAVLYSYDPEFIVLGGSVTKSYDLFQESMWEAIQTFAYRPPLESLQIAVSDRKHVGVLGAAALALDGLPEIKA